MSCPKPHEQPAPRRPIAWCSSVAVASLLALAACEPGLVSGEASRSADEERGIASLLPDDAQSTRERQLIALHNAERSTRGLPLLIQQHQLTAAARKHTRRMIAGTYCASGERICHSRDLGAGLVDGWDVLGENVGAGYSVPTLHDAFMNSPGHRANIVNSLFRFVGVGYKTSLTEKIDYVTVQFMQMTPFVDVPGTTHEHQILTLWAAGVAGGCVAPPRGKFCPDSRLTRASMAVWLVKGLDLPFVKHDYFTDDDGKGYESYVNALAAARITYGCNPPDNDLYCPGDSVTRAQMAAFFVRALALPPAAPGVDYFRDDQGAWYERDANALAAAGITKGCNPPTNDLYCGYDRVTRGQMASFMTRAGLY